MSTLEKAIEYIRMGNREEGRRILEKLLDVEENNKDVWLWLSSVVDKDEDREICLENVLALDPDNVVAKKGLEALQAGTFNVNEMLNAVLGNEKEPAFLDDFIIVEEEVQSDEEIHNTFSEIKGSSFTKPEWQRRSDIPILPPKRKTLSENDPLIGKTIGRYKIISLTYVYGTIRVYKGVHTELGLYTMVRIFNWIPSNDQDFAERCREEIKKLALLRHPNIAQVVDFGEYNDSYFVITEFVEGDDLASLLYISRVTKKQIPHQKLMSIFEGLGNALDYAHTNGVIHRDIRPANIIIRPDGQTALTGFGLWAIPTLDTFNYMTHHPYYNAPEQLLSSDDTKAVSDQYSLGVVLYEAVTDTVPFEGITSLDIAFEHINQSLPMPSKINPDVPAEVEKIILRALSKKPQDRFETVGAMIAALRDTWKDPAAEMDSETPEAEETPEDVFELADDEFQDIFGDIDLQQPPKTKYGRIKSQLTPERRRAVLLIALAGAICVSCCSVSYFLSQMLYAPSAVVKHATTETPNVPYSNASPTPAIVDASPVPATISPVFSPSPLPASVATSLPTTTPSPTPRTTLSPEEYSFANTSATTLFVIMLFIPIIVAVGMVFRPRGQQSISRGVSRLFDNVELTVSSGLGLILFLLGLGAIFLEQGSNNFGATSVALILAAWLLVSEDFYPGLTGSNSNWIHRSSPLFLLGTGYVAIWYGFILLFKHSYTLGTIIVFGISFVFLIGMYIKFINKALRARLADDLFLITLVLGATVIFPGLFPDYSDYYQELFSLTAWTVWAVFAIGLLVQLLHFDDYKVTPIRKIPASFIRFTLSLLGLTLIGQAVYHISTFGMLHPSTLGGAKVVETTIYLMLALLGVFFVIFTVNRSTHNEHQVRQKNQVKDSIEIETTPKEILAALLDVKSAPEWTANLKDVWNVRGHGKGCHYNWEFRMAFIPPLRGETEITEVTNNRFVMQTTGLIPSKWVWKITPILDSYTRLDVTISYELPNNILLVEGIVRSQNAKALEKTLDQLKARLEGNRR